MKKIYLSLTCLVLFLTTSTSLYSQCSNGRYHNYIFTGSPIVSSDIVYGSNTKHDGATQSLKFDVYQPSGDVSASRPVVLIVHGGSFTGGSKTDGDIVLLATQLTKLGYVAVAVEYRLGFPQDQYGFNSAIMRAVHDVRAAVRYLRNNALTGGNTYKIDQANMYIYGVSAGAITALHLAYQNLQGEQNMACNNQPGSECTSIEGTSNSLTVASTVKAIVSVSGGIRDLNWIANNDVPVFLAHGTVDGTVPYGTGTFGGYFPVSGSSTIATKAASTNTVYCFKPLQGQGHTISNPAYVDTVFGIMRNFLESRVCNTTLDCNYTGLPVITTGINNSAEVESAINVYPNPATSGITIDLNMFAGNNIRLELIDALGRNVRNLNHVTAGNYSLERIDLADGIYGLNIYVDEKVYRKKILFE